ncbi:MAG: dTDP-4-dehydrorhamnose 3,5-epimerase [Candidatus Pacebacteria bacterium]|nr:dTDP-4-dehydrorhamnose 3,5-epimerase [Candidatus Paceibacterota bacterium]
MEIIPTKLEGVLIIKTNLFEDDRGSFVKTFNEESFSQLGIQPKFKESFYSISKKNVARGMHFHVPPKDHSKLVYVTQGSALDIVLDIRKGSPTYGEHITIELSQKNHQLLFIPSGFAHGFISQEDNTCMIYLQTGMYSPKEDSGISLNSIDVFGKNTTYIISERDKDFISFKDFDSPFVYNHENSN